MFVVPSGTIESAVRKWISSEAATITFPNLSGSLICQVTPSVENWTSGTFPQILKTDLFSLKTTERKVSFRALTTKGAKVRLLFAQIWQIRDFGLVSAPDPPPPNLTLGAKTFSPQNITPVYAFLLDNCG